MLHPGRYHRHATQAGNAASFCTRSMTMKAAIQQGIIDLRRGGDDDEGGHSWRKP